MTIEVAVILFIVALVIVALELFIPSGGILSFLAAAMAAASIISAFVVGQTEGVIFLGITGVATPLVVWGGFKILPYTPIGKAIATGSDLPQADRQAVDQREKALVGQTGVARTPLRPSGVAEIAGDNRDVVTQGELLSPGTTVQVIKVEGNRIVVREIG